MLHFIQVQRLQGFICLGVYNLYHLKSCHLRLCILHSSHTHSCPIFPTCQAGCHIRTFELGDSCLCSEDSQILAWLTTFLLGVLAPMSKCHFFHKTGLLPAPSYFTLLQTRSQYIQLLTIISLSLCPPARR